jgi:hypothetical protein
MVFNTAKNGNRDIVVRRADGAGDIETLVTGPGPAVAALSGDGRGSPRGARLLAVAVGEQHAFLRQAIDVRRPVEVSIAVGCGLLLCLALSKIWT